MRDKATSALSPTDPASARTHRIGDDLETEAVQAGKVDFIGQGHPAQVIRKRLLFQIKLVGVASLLDRQDVQSHGPAVQLACLQ